MNHIDPFATDHFYHIFNKTLDFNNPFSDDSLSNFFLTLAWYYRSVKRSVSYSVYRNIDDEIKNQIKIAVNNPDNYQIDILCYCLMPNHYHFLLKQKIDYGISKYISDITNSFTKTFNLINNRKGPLFIPQFKSRLIHTEEQLIHVSRYIHLNPYSSNLLNDLGKLSSYRYSSYKEYISNSYLVNKSYILDSNYFLGNKEKYRIFVENRADYQKSLEVVKYIKKWC